MTFILHIEQNIFETPFFTHLAKLYSTATFEANIIFIKTLLLQNPLQSQENFFLFKIDKENISYNNQ